MSDHEDRLEEYIDGVLSEEECLRVEAALARDPELRGELARVRRFGRLLEGLRDAGAEERGLRRVMAAVERAGRWERRRALVVRLPLAAVLLVAAGITGFLVAPRSDRSADGLTLVEGWQDYGRRLGAIAAARRQGRVPRIGLSGLEVPPASAAGLVFLEALDELGVGLGRSVRDRVHYLVREHFEDAGRTGTGVEGEAERTAAALTTYRKLRRVAGPDAADAFYDVFRLGLPDLDTASPVPEGALVRVLERELDPAAAERYLRAYEETVRRLRGRYGAERVRLVLDRLAPRDRRFLRRDARQDGVAPDAVLAIRAQLYRAAEEAGSDRLYVALQ
ncbi:MAG: zf-HC2 domain-containing protein [Planctomycetota bacterium]